MASKRRAIGKGRKRSEVWAEKELELQHATTVTTTIGDSTDADDLGK